MVRLEEMNIDPKSYLPSLKTIGLSAGSYPLEWAQKAEEIWGTEFSEFYACASAGAVVAAIVLSMLAVRYLLPRSPRLVDGPYLDATLQGARDRSDQLGSVRVGAEGRALSFLRPAGKADIDGELLDVISEGEFIEKDAAIRVVDIRGNRILVTKRSEP